MAGVKKAAHKRKGKDHHRWNNGVIVGSNGYKKIRVGKEHPLADPNGYAYEHLVVWVSAGHDRPGRGWVIHHKNSDPLDNRIENLELVQRGSHNHHHNEERGRNEKGQFNPRKS